MSAPSLRRYQQRILETILDRNTIVLLPTGTGKTWIAADAIVRLGSQSVFFVPTIPLVAQQAHALRSRPGMALVEEFHGEVSLPSHFGVLVTTPKAFESAQARGEEILQWERFNVVVFDECHHVIKDHPYRNLALKLKHHRHRPRIIGLTASMTYAIGAKKIERSMNRLCAELCVESIENATDDELRVDGYLGAGRASVAEVRLPIHVSTQNTIAQWDRKPHLMHQIFFKRVREGEATSFGIKLVAVIQKLEKEAKRNCHDFISPLTSVSLKSWGICAKKKSTAHPCFGSLEHWYESLRLLVISWEEDQDAAVMFLGMMQQHKQEAILDWSAQTRSLIVLFFDEFRVASTPRFDNLSSALRDKLSHHQDFRGIVFVRQRVMVHIVQYAVKRDVTLMQNIQTCCLYSAKAPATASLSISRRDAEDALKKFASGEANLLITTNVAEEGLDIPAANCVMYFDPMDHAVSYVQGRGRARQANSSFVMLNERQDRPASLLAAMEAEQHAIASTFIPAASNQNSAVDRHSQSQRENGASRYLFSPTMDTALAKLNTYCKKTKVVLDETVCARGFTCEMTYRSVLRNITISGQGNGKKVARKTAAIAMLKALSLSTSQSLSSVHILHSPHVDDTSTQN